MGPVTVSDSVLVVVPAVFEALMLMLWMLGVATEPLMTGDAKVNPAGRLVAVNVVGAFVAVMV